MKKSKVILRADGSTKIGYGHVYRTLAMAHMLKDHFDCYFVSHNKPEFLSEKLKELSINFIKVNSIDYAITDGRLNNAEVPFDMDDILSGDEIVVIDGYWFGSEYQKTIKNKGAKLVCIDDLHDKKFYADLVINHVPGVKYGDYDACSYTQFALGTEYALLRPVFLEYAKLARNIADLQTCLICFGGSDFKNLTKQTLDIAIRLNFFKKIIVVTGESYQFLDTVDTDLKSVVHYHNISEDKIASLLLEADLAIIPASGILYEALAMKNIIITGKYTDNQSFFLQEFTKLNNVFNAHDFSKTNLEYAINLARQSALDQSEVIDGFSGQRLVNLISRL